ncbi:alpha/beta fold hydrolase [Arthrobacter castelli]|uniref:alpha/beta fold hydrolase n=1 Tax=Arthrobacter castelli TaxID=271431 RepID=UPI0003F7227F|nr:alpha/beta fold hydrolase [Arthrobacter castelli]
MGSATAAHRMISTVDRAGMRLTDHQFDVPLNHGTPQGESLRIFAREAVDPGRFPDTALEDAPWLLYLQGGPGMAANRPLELSGWLKEALKHFRVLLLDQRGTGRSSPVNRQTLPTRGGVEEQVQFLRHFRADSIVADAELIRTALGSGPWSILGQSFGGFCALTYLSAAPHGLRETMITGGLGPVAGTAADVYRETYAAVQARNEEFYGWYPQDVAAALRIAAHVERVPEYLPTGERLSVRRFQMLGMLLGGNARVHELHFLLEDPFVDTAAGPRLSDGFLHQAGSILSFAANPLYALMHESIYAQGASSGWAAWHESHHWPQFGPDADPLLFTGEMIHPWLFTEDPALVPLAGTARALADIDDWPALYDLDQLGRNEVPAAAAVYADDIFVPHSTSMQTAAAVQGLRVWETSEYHHDGLRQDGERVFRQLLERCRASRHR